MEHRTFVGGDFDNIGKWQFDYLTTNTNLSNESTFLDIACGCFRLGKLLIPVLNKNNYYGIDANKSIVDAGFEHELTDELVLSKSPLIIVNSTFDFSFCPRFDIAWANSLLSHLNIDDIELLFNNLSSSADLTSEFYFTYFDRQVSKQNKPNPKESHSRKDFFYTWEEISELLTKHGWTGERMLVQSHPRQQVIVKAKLQ